MSNSQIAEPTLPTETQPNFIFEVFYDGECPLCRREINFLKSKDRKGRIRFSDLQNLQLNTPEIPRTYDQLMAEIHGRFPDGTWVTGVEVFRRLYDAIGWTWVVAPTRWPLIRNVLNVGYRFFAKRRLALTGRCNDSCEVERG
jgi:predicted DCC family thiol-disulfide oxidoreductase YuxK